VEEHALMEVHLSDSFSSKWSAVRARASPIINQFYGTPLDSLTDAIGLVELDVCDNCDSVDDEVIGSDYEE
jgi:hypothetical protein